MGAPRAPGALMSVALDLDHANDTARPARPGTPSLVGLSRAELAETLEGTGIDAREARMRAAQLWNWIYHRGVTDFEAMSDIGKAFRQTLADSFRIDRPEIVHEQV